MAVKHILSTLVFAVAATTGAQAASVTCGNASLGVRVTTIDPGLVGGLCYANLTNLGDPALVSLVNSLTSSSDAAIVDRDTTNNNGGALNITGVGLLAGNWSFASTAWDTNDRVFLYFHFGDGPDNPGPGSTTDPDIFIIELMSPDTAGAWSFSGTNGLSNIALIGTGDGGGGGSGSSVPEPATFALAGLALLGLAATTRRRRV